MRINGLNNSNYNAAGGRREEKEGCEMEMGWDGMKKELSSAPFGTCIIAHGAARARRVGNHHGGPRRACDRQRGRWGATS
jgi:hypothetical protein